MKKTNSSRMMLEDKFLVVSRRKPIVSTLPNLPPAMGD